MAGKVYSITEPNPSVDLGSKVAGEFATILADPPWQFQNRTGKMAPEHRRLLRYPTMELKEILELFARFPRQGWRQWGNEDVEENHQYGVAKRKGHEDPQMRLFETPRGYGKNVRR